MDDLDVIHEQIEYYRRRAAEYDVTVTPLYDALASFIDELAAALDRFRPVGDVLEIASGTGGWTLALLRHASCVTAIDSSQEMHDQAQHKIGEDPRVRFLQADIFSWRADRQYDVVFFANWLSHVPPSRFGSFWETIEAAVKPGGRIFFVDEGRDAVWRHEDIRDELVAGAHTPLDRRSLKDGSRFRVVKVYWDPAELGARLREHGWAVTIHLVGPFFWGRGTTSRRLSWTTRQRD